MRKGMIESFTMDAAYYRSMGKPPVVAYPLAVYGSLKQLLMMAICAVVGHVLVDGDPGDPEVGPQPDIYCERCGW